MTRVHPMTELASKKSSKKTKIIKRWLISFIGFPLAYIMLPVSCCVRNPVAKVLFDEEHDNNKITENIITGCFGVSTLALCCGCCCGYCGEVDPIDF